MKKTKFTTTLPIDIIKDFKIYAVQEGIKSNIILENILKDFLQKK